MKRLSRLLRFVVDVAVAFAFMWEAYWLGYRSALAHVIRGEQASREAAPVCNWSRAEPICTCPTTPLPRDVEIETWRCPAHGLCSRSYLDATTWRRST